MILFYWDLELRGLNYIKAVQTMFFSISESTFCSLNLSLVNLQPFRHTSMIQYFDVNHIKLAKQGLNNVLHYSYRDSAINII